MSIVRFYWTYSHGTHAFSLVKDKGCMGADLLNLHLQLFQILEGLRLLAGVTEKEGGVVQRHHQRAVLVEELPVLLRNFEVLADELHGADTA